MSFNRFYFSTTAFFFFPQHAFKTRLDVEAWRIPPATVIFKVTAGRRLAPRRTIWVLQHNNNCLSWRFCVIIAGWVITWKPTEAGTGEKKKKKDRRCVESASRTKTLSERDSTDYGAQSEVTYSTTVSVSWSETRPCDTFPRLPSDSRRFISTPCEPGAQSTDASPGSSTFNP